MMLSIKDLKISFGNTQILRGVDLHLEMGDCLGPCGRVGCRKDHIGTVHHGSGQRICLWADLLSRKGPPQDFRKRSQRIARKRYGYGLSECREAVDPVQRIKDQIAEAITVHRCISAKKAGYVALQRLLSVGLNGEKARLYPHQLSGGEKQRVLIAMALVNDPDILILDEPTASLDALTKADVLRLFHSAVLGRICIVITHDISLASLLARQMAVLYAGRIMEMGRTKDLLRNPRHPYTRGLIRSYPGMTTTKDLQGIPGRMVHGLQGCPFHERCTQKIDICSLQVPPQMEKDDRIIACHRGGIVPLLEIKNLSLDLSSYPALRDVSLSLYEGETLAMVGESGSGKTTLSKVIMGLYDADRGDVILDGQRVNKWDCAFYSRVQMIFQNPKESVSHRMNVLDAVIEPLQVQRKGSHEARFRKAKEVLQLVELPIDDDFLKRYPHELSGGEVQRVAIARALVLGPKLLIADEPTSALDPSVQAQDYEATNESAGEDGPSHTLCNS